MKKTASKHEEERGAKKENETPIENKQEACGSAAGDTASAPTRTPAWGGSRNQGRPVQLLQIPGPPRSFGCDRPSPVERGRFGALPCPTAWYHSPLPPCFQHTAAVPAGSTRGSGWEGDGGCGGWAGVIKPRALSPRMAAWSCGVHTLTGAFGSSFGGYQR